MQDPAYTTTDPSRLYPLDNGLMQEDDGYTVQYTPLSASRGLGDFLPTGNPVQDLLKNVMSVVPRIFGASPAPTIPNPVAAAPSPLESALPWLIVGGLAWLFLKK